MTFTFAPTQAAVESAINRNIGNPGFFQRVAEQVACGLYPRLASSLVPYGRNPNDKTIRGWPDAYLTKEDGTLIAIEATTAVDARTNHWKTDLTNLETRLPVDRRGGLVWIAWCDPSAPTDEGDMREQVYRLGFAREDVHIVFRRQLCSLLLAPFHARFWLSDLQIAVTPDPFSRISDVIRRGAQSKAVRMFPTLEEFKTNCVHSPRILPEVEKALEEHGAAIVVGQGASGKTTIAYLLAHRNRFKHAPAYILDLTATASDPTFVERASEALIACADRGVLFVLDNAHLDSEAADRLIEQWKAFGQGSELLVLMRHVRAKAEVWERDPKVEESGLPCFSLIIESSDLEGVYRRHYQALKGQFPPQLEAATLANWMSLFGGDLIAFSAGVLGLLERGGEPANLGPDDARAWVRHHYLKGPESALSALLDLAAVAEIEGLVPTDAFAEGVLTSFIQRGVVWVEERGSKRNYYYYRLVHPGLGTLLRRSAGCEETSREDRCRLLRDHTFACTSVVLAQAGAGNIAEAQALLEELWQRSIWPLSDINIGYWGGPLRLSEKLGVVSAEEMSERSRAWLAEDNSRKTVLKSALASTLSHLAGIFNFTAQKTPEIYKALREDLSSMENRPYLTENVLTSYVGGVRSFIEFAKDQMPEVGLMVTDILIAEENRDGVVRAALQTSLNGVAYFLDYADGKMPEVAKAIRAGLAKDPDALLRQALTTPLEHLASFLGYADGKMPEVAKAIRAGLAKDPDALLRWALTTPLDHLASFLGYARANMADIEKVWQSQLLTGVSLIRMADRALQDGPQMIAALCKYDRAYAQLLPMIDTEIWSRRWGNVDIGQPNWFIGFASNCYSQGRGDLVGPIAATIMRNAGAKDFPSPGITIRHLTYIVTAPHGCTTSEVKQFISRCFAPQWLGTQYNSPDATMGALAGAVWSIATNEQELVRRHFLHPALFKRLVSEQPTNRHPSRQVASWLQLLGATRLLGHDESLGIRPMSSQTICEALKVWPPGPKDQGIQAIQAGIWAGLREWCHITQSQMNVPPEIAEAVHAQFRAADAIDRPRVAALNAVMIDWLDRCKGHGWKIIADEVPLLNAVERQIQLSRGSD